MKQDFSPLQEKEISLGFKHGLEKHEVQVYAKEKFNYLLVHYLLPYYCVQFSAYSSVPG